MVNFMAFQLFHVLVLLSQLQYKLHGTESRPYISTLTQNQQSASRFFSLMSWSCKYLLQFLGRSITILTKRKEQILVTRLLSLGLEKCQLCICVRYSSRTTSPGGIHMGEVKSEKVWAHREADQGAARQLKLEPLLGRGQGFMMAYMPDYLSLWRSPSLAVNYPSYSLFATKETSIKMAKAE